MRVIREPTACYAAFREDLAVVKGREGVLDFRGCLQILLPQGYLYSGLLLILSVYGPGDLA